MLKPLGPIYTGALLEPLHEALMSVLGELPGEAWERATVAGSWRVRDIAAHLVDTSFRRLSVERDGHALAPDRAIEGYGDLVRFLNALNASWVEASRRLSTPILLELLDLACPAAARFLAGLPPHGRAVFAVSWAGEDESEAWMDVGREYTEWWHHQMQIREAVGAPLLLDRRFGAPLIEISVRVLPAAYRDVPAADGTAVVLHVEGEAGGSFSIVREDGPWRLYLGAHESPAAVVRASVDTAWRLLYNALPPGEARARTSREGDEGLAAPLLGARSVMV